MYASASSAKVPFRRSMPGLGIFAGMPASKRPPCPDAHRVRLITNVLINQSRRPAALGERAGAASDQSGASLPSWHPHPIDEGTRPLRLPPPAPPPPRPPILAAATGAAWRCRWRRSRTWCWRGRRTGSTPSRSTASSRWVGSVMCLYERYHKPPATHTHDRSDVSIQSTIHACV